MFKLVKLQNATLSIIIRQFTIRGRPMDLGDRVLYNREEKLSYIIKFLNLKTNDIAQKLEISAGLVSQIQIIITIN